MKIKHPSERRIRSLYGDNKAGAKRYRRGWYNAGRIIHANRNKSKKSTT